MGGGIKMIIWRDTEMTRFSKERLAGIIFFCSFIISLKLYAMNFFSFRILLYIMGAMIFAILIFTRDILFHGNNKQKEYPAMYKIQYIGLIFVLIIILLFLLATIITVMESEVMLRGVLT